MAEMHISRNNTWYETGRRFATQTEPGFMLNEDKRKLDNIESNAQVNQNAFSSILITTINALQNMLNSGDPVYINANTPTDTLNLVGQDGIDITAYPTENKITISIAQDPTHRLVTDDQIATWNALVGETVTWSAIIDKPTTIEGYGITDDTKVEASITNGNILINGQEVAVYAPTTYTHIQAIPSTQWIIIHNLNRNPSVTVVDSAGSVVYGDIIYDSLNQLTISFSAGFSGKAYLN
jgi:hypothetical protein